MRTIVLFFTFIVSTCAFAQMSADSLWGNANAKYTEGKFDEAAQLYEIILNEKGESAEVYFNLGNAYFKQNKQGPAHLNYERALRLDPKNSDIIYNIEYLNALQQDRIDIVQDAFLTNWINGVTNMFSQTTWSVVFFATMAMSLALLFTFMFSKTSKIKKLSFASLCLCLLLTMSSFYLGYRQRAQILNKTEAIIFAKEVKVKSAPGNTGSDLFTIHEGLKVNIIEKQSDYYRIILDDGKSQGWISRDVAEII